MAGAQKTSQFTPATVANPNDEVPLLQGGVLKRVPVKVLTGNPDVGWLASGESWVFSAFSSTTRIGVVTVPSDATTKYMPGNRVRVVQATGGTKYGIIHMVTATALHIFFPSGVTLNNEAITASHYSPLDSPVGFNKDTALWELLLENTAEILLSGLAAGVWYNPGSLALSLGVGAYDLGYEVNVETLGASNADAKVTLSTSNSSMSDLKFTTWSFNGVPNGGTLNNVHPHKRNRNITLSTPATYYLNFMSTAGLTSMKWRGADGTTRISALTRYL